MCRIPFLVKLSPLPGLTLIVLLAALVGEVQLSQSQSSTTTLRIDQAGTTRLAQAGQTEKALEATTHLYDASVARLGPSQEEVEQRHLYTSIWAGMSLILSHFISLIKRKLTP